MSDAEQFPTGYRADEHGVQGMGTMRTWAQLIGLPTVNRLHPEFLRRVIAVCEYLAAQGVPLGIGTGWRSYAQQAAGYAADPTGHARPDNSNHCGFGPDDRDAVAADMVIAMSWDEMEHVLARAGLRSFKLPSTSGYTGKAEAWHIQPIEIPASRNRRTTPWELERFDLSGLGVPADHDPVPVPEPLPEPDPTVPTTLTRTDMQITKTTLDPAQRAALRGNADVALFQIYANGLTGAGLAIDGDYGPATQAAARNCQAFGGLTADAVIGPKSWAAFLNADGQ